MMLSQEQQKVFGKLLRNHPLPWTHGSSWGDGDHEWIKDADGDVIATDIAPGMNEIIVFMANTLGPMFPVAAQDDDDE